MEELKQNLPPQRHLNYFLISAFLLILGVVLYLYNNNNVGKISNPNPPLPNVTSPTNIETVVIQMYGKIIFPKVTGSSIAATSNISTDFMGYILKNASSLELKNLVYSDGRQGSYISYTLATSSLSAISQQLSDLSLQDARKLLSAATTEKFAIIDYQEGTLFKARVSLTLLETNKIFVNIQTLNLKP